jgi:hypothetical protein
VTYLWINVVLDVIFIVILLVWHINHLLVGRDGNLPIIILFLILVIFLHGGLERGSRGQRALFGMVPIFGDRVLLYFSWVLLRVRVNKMRRHDAGFTADFRGEGGIA